jgi:hypothetical protein
LEYNAVMAEVVEQGVNQQEEEEVAAGTTASQCMLQIQRSMRWWIGCGARMREIEGAQQEEGVGESKRGVIGGKGGSKKDPAHNTRALNANNKLNREQRGLPRDRYGDRTRRSVVRMTERRYGERVNRWRQGTRGWQWWLVVMDGMANNTTMVVGTVGWIANNNHTQAIPFTSTLCVHNNNKAGEMKINKAIRISRRRERDVW